MTRVTGAGAGAGPDTEIEFRVSELRRVYGGFPPPQQSRHSSKFYILINSDIHSPSPLAAAFA